MHLGINFFWILGSFSTFRLFHSYEFKKVSGRFPDTVTVPFLPLPWSRLSVSCIVAWTQYNLSYDTYYYVGSIFPVKNHADPKGILTHMFLVLFKASQTFRDTHMWASDESYPRVRHVPFHRVHMVTLRVLSISVTWPSDVASSLTSFLLYVKRDPLSSSLKY